MARPLAPMLALVLAVLLAGGALAVTIPIAAAAPQTAGNASTTPDGPYTLDELRRGGVKPADAPTSVRYLGATGAVALRHEPGKPLENDYDWVEPGETIHTDKLQLYSTRFGRSIAEREYQLRLVFWQLDTRTVKGPNGTTRREQFAANQTIGERTLELGTGYDTTNVTMRAHFDQEWRVTAFLLDADGTQIEGAVWTFRHQTLRTLQSIDIDSKQDALIWGGTNIGGAALLTLLLGIPLTTAAVRRAGRGPQKGVVWWVAFVVVPTLFVTVTVGYFYTAQLLARGPQLLGGLIGVIAVVVMLEKIGPTERTTEFVRDELEDGESHLNDGALDHEYRDKARVRTVRREADGTLGLIKPGIRPFLARLFAEPATLDVSDLKTRISLRHGPDDELFVADPESDEPLVWTPAHWSFEPRLLKDLDDPEARKSMSAPERLLGRLNVTLLVGTGIAAAVGRAVGNWLFSAPQSGALLAGAAAFLALSMRAKDGYADFEAAPGHYRPSRASIWAKAIKYADGKTLEDQYEIAWKAQGRTAREVQQLQRLQDERVSQEMLKEEAGYDPTRVGDPDLEINPDDGEDGPAGASTGPEPAATDGGTDDEQGGDAGE